MSSNNVDLLLNLFEQMFDCNPYERITIDKILKHECIFQHKDNISFYINDSTLEAFVRDIYHQNEANKNEDGNDQVAFHSGITQHTQLSNKTNQLHKIVILNNHVLIQQIHLI